MEDKEAILVIKPNELLRQARAARGWTQQQLAEKLEISYDTVRAWERGRRTPSVTQRARLCALFGLSPAELGLEPLEAPETPVPEDDLAPFDEQITVRRERLNRRRMLGRVKSTWIDGFLKQSLHRMTLLELGLQEQPEALVNPWRYAVQETDAPPRPLPVGTSISEVYDQASGSLLILGEPGGGKTTTLLDLLRTLLKRAEQDEEVPIPVVFNLSEWATKQAALATWFVEELVEKYHVPRPVAQLWIEQDTLTVLLDGLDEVPDAARPACVNAISTYLEDHMVSMVVCCRIGDYYELSTRVPLLRAVAIQPLTIQQIDLYLYKAGAPLAAMRQALDADVALLEMVKTPLMLSIISLAYRGKGGEALALTGTIDARRQQALHNYVERMLTRRGASDRYRIEETTRWLTWLARQMQRRSLSEFHLERLQPDWLPAGPSGPRYRNLVLRFIYGFDAVLVATLFAWIRGGKVGQAYGVGEGLFGLLGAPAGNALLGPMALGVGGGVEGGGSLGILLVLVFSLLTLLIGIASFPRLGTGALWYGLKRGAMTALKALGLIGPVCVLIFAALGGIVHGLIYGIGMGLFCGLLVGLQNGLIAGLRYDPRALAPVDPPRTFRERMIDGLVHGLSAGVSFALVDAVMHITIQSVIVYSFIAGLFMFFAFGFGGGSTLIPRLGVEIKPAETVSWHWSGIGRFLASGFLRGLLLGIVITFCVGVVIGSASSVFYGWQYGLRYGLIYGSITGLIAGVAGTLAGILNSAWQSEVLDERQFFRPNQGIRRSLANAIIASVLFGILGGIASGLVCGAAFGLIGELPGWPILAIGFAIVFGVMFEMQFGTIYGGSAWVQHYVLRWYLWRGGFMPLNYVAFLDFAAQRILLQKVRGGYMFAHRTLLEYFASLPLPGEDA